MKQRFKDRVQKAANHLLSNTVSNRWNPQRAFTRLILGDVNSSESLRLKTTGFQVPHQSLNIVEKVSLEHLDAHLVDARCSAIAFDGCKCLAHQGQSDSSG